MLGRHCIKTWSSTQGAVALSSAEAEFYAMVDAATKVKWMMIVAEEMGCGAKEGELVMRTDSSAARSFVGRRGLGRMRHIEVRELWLQEEVLKGRVRVEKVPGEENPADLMTKFLSEREILGRLGRMGMRRTVGNPVRRPGVGDTEGGKPKRGGRDRRLVRGRWADEGDEGDLDMKKTAEWWRDVERVEMDDSKDAGDQVRTTGIGRVGVASPLSI